jgi:hypothetical protein
MILFRVLRLEVSSEIRRMGCNIRTSCNSSSKKHKRYRTGLEDLNGGTSMNSFSNTIYDRPNIALWFT